MTTFISEHLWGELKSQAKATKRRSFVAVAYLSPGAFDRLPLKPKSLLVVNCNEATVKGGTTDPKEVKRYLDHGVKVHNVSNLHAKVFVLGTRVFVGSANVSKSSEGLLEAAVTSTDRKLVRECKQFVQSLAGELITPAELERLIPLYVPNRNTNRATNSQRKRSIRKTVPKHNPLWAVRTNVWYMTEEEQDADRKATPKARQELSSDEFRIEKFFWPADNSAFLRNVRKGDTILQVHRSGNSVSLIPPGKVVLVYRFRRQMIVYMQVKKRLHDKSMTKVRKTLPTAGKFLGAVKGSMMIRIDKIVHDVQHLWGLE